MIASVKGKVRFNRHVLGWLICTVAVGIFGAVAHSAEGPGAGLHKLTGPQIQRLFEEIGTVSYPNDGSGVNDTEWNINFQPNGTWEAGGGLQMGTFGVWHVNGDMQCVEYKGGFDRHTQDLYEGCFTVYVDPEKGVVVANIPELNLDRFELTDIAYDAIASLALKQKPPTAQATAPNPLPSTDQSVPQRQVASAGAPANIIQGFSQLTGPQIQRLFEEIGTGSYPSDGDDYGGGREWNMNFQPNGTWEGTSGMLVAFGVWHVNGDMLCVEYKGGESESFEQTRFEEYQPAQGCFAVYAKPDSGELAAEIPELGPKLIVLTTIAYSEIARAFGSKPAPTPQVTTRPSQRPPAAADQALALERQKFKTEKRALERRRLALDRERLQRQRARLEQEERERLQQHATLEQDRTPPVIRTATVLKTNQPHVTIGGSVSDTSGIAAVQVDGKEVPFSAADGRFSVKTSVAIGRNSIRIAAIDIHGNRAERVVSVDRKRRIPKVDFGDYYALVIGIEDYKQLPKLKTAVDDAKAVAAMLREKYGFTVSSLINPSRDDILDAFDELAETLEKSDNLLIYYAGHGWQDDKTGRGYWLPVNAKANRKSRWFSNVDLTDSLKVIAAKHVMVVADSCYSGTLARSIKVPDRNSEYIARMAAKRTRVVLSSGGLEPVMDSGGGKHSVFANEFLKALDANEAVMDGTKLFEQVRRRVVLNSDQTPEYSDIRRAGHEGGDFLFVRKD